MNLQTLEKLLLSKNKMFALLLWKESPLYINGSMKDRFLIDMIDDSYNLVVSKLTKKEKLELENI